MEKINWDEYSSIGTQEDTEVSTATVMPEATETDTGIDWEQYDGLGASDPLAAEPETPVIEAEPVDDDFDLDDIAGDVGSAFGIGSGQLAKGGGQLLDWIGLDDAGESLKRIGQRAVEYYQGGLSETAKEEMNKEFVTVKEGGKWYNPVDWERPEDAAGIYAAFLMGVESLPATAVGMGVGGKIGSGLYSVAQKTKTMKALARVSEVGAARFAQGKSALDPLVKAGKRADRIQKAVGATTGAVGYGTGEALPAAGMAGVQVNEQIEAMDHDDLFDRSEHYREFFDASAGLNMTLEERIADAKTNIAEIASSQAGLEAGLWTAILGAPMGMASAPLFNKAVPWAFKGGKVRGALTEGVGEAMQEFAQSGTEQYVSNLAIKEYADETLDATRDVVNAAVGGAVSGFGMGAAMGAAGTPAKGKQAASSTAESDVKLQGDLEKLNAFSHNAVNGLVESHGRTEEEAVELITPVLEQFSVDKNIISAISSLRHMEKYGRVREVGVDDQANALEGIQLQPDGNRNGIDYFMIENTVGADGGRIDAMRDQGATGNSIHLIEQVKEDGTFDEHKVVLGSATEEEAVATYQRYYRGFDDETDRNIGSVTAMNEVEFTEWSNAASEEHSANLNTREVVAEQQAEVQSAQERTDEDGTVLTLPDGETPYTAEPTAEKTDVPRETSKAVAPVIETDTSVAKAKNAAAKASDIRYSLSREGTKAKGGSPYVFDKTSREWVKNKGVVKAGSDEWADNYLKIIDTDKHARVSSALGYKTTERRVRSILKHMTEGRVAEAKKEYTKLSEADFRQAYGDALWVMAKKAGTGVKGTYNKKTQRGRIQVTKTQAREALDLWAADAPAVQQPLFSLSHAAPRWGKKGSKAHGFISQSNRPKTLDDAIEILTMPSRTYGGWQGGGIVGRQGFNRAELNDLLTAAGETPSQYSTKEDAWRKLENIWGENSDKADKVGRKRWSGELPRFSLKEGQKGPWTTKTTGEGDLYITRHGTNAGTPHKTRQSPNDLVISFDHEQLLPDYAFYLLQYLQPKIAASARGTAQQAIRKGDVDDALMQYFLSKGPRYSLKELERRRKASDRMTEYNAENTDKRSHLVKTFMRADWSAVEKDVDSATAGAVTADETQDAIIEWLMRGVKSKYFKRWFGESKTTDYWGEPIRFFHGTGFDINAFKPSRGFVSLTTSPDFAAKFADEFQLGENRPVIYQLYVKAEKIFDFRDRKMRRSLTRYLKKTNNNDHRKLIGEVKSGKWAALETFAIQNFMRERGYDAFWMKEGGTMNLGVFDPRNIKSAVGNVGTFSRLTPQIRYSLKAPDTDEVFYSTIEQWVAEKMPPKMPTSQLIQAFSTPKALEKKGVKKEEASDLGIVEWAETLGKTVTKEEALEFVRKHRVVLSEVEIRPDVLAVDYRSTFDDASATQQIENVYTLAQDSMIDVGVDPMEAEAVIEQLRKDGISALDGMLTPRQVAEFGKRLDQAKLDLWQAEFESNLKESADEIRAGETKYEDYSLIEGSRPTYREFLMKIPAGEQRSTYKTRHWDDDNVLIHMRLHGQFDSDTGKTTLVVEEIQSDLHQHGYRYGYSPSTLSQEEYNELNRETGKVPDAPMRQSWKLVGMKRMIRYAVENGYDSVAWTQGKHHQDRYSLAKSGVTKIGLVEEDAGGYPEYRLELYGAGSQLYQPTPWVRQHMLGDFISEELVDKLLAKKKSGEPAELIDEEVIWGANALKSFYDNNLKKLTSKYIKKWDGRVGLKDMQIVDHNGNQKTETLWSFEVTEKMRDSVMKGQPLYSLSPSAASEISRRIELFQIRDYIENHISSGAKPRAALAHLNEGVIRGFYSEEALRHSGVTHNLSDKVKMLMGISSRLRGSPISARTSLSGQVLRQEITRVMRGWENPPIYHVHDNWTELPPIIRNEVLKGGHQSKVEGVVDPMDGSLHFVAENIGTIHRLHEVFVEEALGHHGLRSFFGQELMGFLNEITPALKGSDAWKNLHSTYTHLRPADRKERVAVLMAEYGLNKDEANVAYEDEERNKEWASSEELIAKMDVEQSVWEKFVGWMRQFFRRAGMLNGYTDNDFRALMNKVHSHVMNGTTPHPWGKAHKPMVYRSGPLAFSLYGGKDGVMLSQLEEALKKLDPKSKPKNYLTRIKGSDEVNWSSFREPSNMQAAQNLGFRESELELTYVTNWLMEQHHKAPNKSITRDQILDVFTKSKPRIQAVSRAGYYLFPSIPFSDLLKVQAGRTQKEFDRDRAADDVGFFSDRLRLVLNDAGEMREVLGIAADTHTVITPKYLWDIGYVTNPFGSLYIPSMQDFIDRGTSESEISQMVGVVDMNAPLSYENSNAQIKGWVAEQLMNKAQTSGREYNSHIYSVDLSLHGYYGNARVSVRISNGADGEPDAAYAVNSKQSTKLIEYFNQSINRRAAMFKAELEYNDTIRDQPPETIALRSGARLPTTHEMFERDLKKYVTERFEQMKGIEPEELTPEAVFPDDPDVGKLLIGLTTGSISTTNKPMLGEGGSSTRGENLYESYTLEGGNNLDVISIQLYGDNTNKGNGGSGNYHYDSNLRQDVVHMRVKERVGENGERIFGIEEIQSDWASNYRKAHLKRPAVTAFGEKHHLLLWKVMGRLYQHYGFAPEGLTQDAIDMSNYLQSESEAANEVRAHEWFVGGHMTGSVMLTGITTNAAVEMLTKVDKALAGQFRSAMIEYKNIDRNWNKMPWVSNYYELALKAAVGWAKETGFDAVAWPEGGHVARIYGGHMGYEADGFTIDPRTMRIFGSNSGLTDEARADRQGRQQAWDNIQAGNMGAAHGGYHTTDYLGDIIREGGPNAAVAKDAARALQAWMDGPPEVRSGEQNPENQETSWVYKIAEIDNPYLKWDATEDRLMVMLPEVRLWNAKLHRLLYNQLLPQVAREIAKDTKAMKKAGNVSTGHVYIPDAYNIQWRGRRSNEAEGTQQAVAGENTAGWIFADDHYGSTLQDHHRDRTQNSVMLFGRDGYTYRVDAANWMQGRPSSARTLTNWSETEEAIRINEKWDSVVFGTVDMKLKSIHITHGLDFDGIAPYSGSMVFEVVSNANNAPVGEHAVMFPIADYDDQPRGGRYQDFAGGNADSARAPAVYRMGYQIMKYVWGIENPNPLIIKPEKWKQIIRYFKNSLSAYEEQDTAYYPEEGGDKVWYGSEIMQQMDDVISVFRGERDLNRGREPSAYAPHKVPFDYDYETSEDEAIEASEYIKPDVHNIKLSIPDDLLEMIKEHGTITDKGAAAVMLSYFSDSSQMPDNNDRVDIEALWELLPNHADPAVNAAIPPAYYDNLGGESGAAEIAGEAEVEEEKPTSRVENPEWEEQVWHAIFINDRVKERPLFMPFSLRGDGNDKVRSIVSQKIAKSHSQMSVLDRVTHWVSVLQDKIKTGDLLWGMKQGVLDKAASVERWEKELFDEIQDASVSPYKMMHMVNNLPSVMAAISKVGVPEMRDGAFQPVDGRKGFIEIFRPIYEHPESDLMELWEGYAAAKRSHELLGQRNQDGTDREKLFSREEVDELLRLENKYPVFKNVFEDWTNFNNDLLNLAVSEGVLSATERDAWAKNAYVPFYRAMEEIEGVDQRTGMGKIKSGVAGQHSAIKRLRGSQQKLGNITENLWFNTASLIDKVYKNHAMNRVVDMLDGVAMKEVEMPWEAIRVTNSQIAAALKKAGILTGDAEAQVKAMSADQKMFWNTIFRRVRPTADNVVGVMKAGKMKYYEVSDPQLLVTLTGMGAEGLTGLMKAMGLSKSVLTRMITVDPGFMLANWLRDTLSAWVTSDANFVPVADSIKAMGDVFGEKGSFIKMMMSGAGGGGFYDLTGGNVTKVLDEELSRGTSKWLGKAWKGYMKLGAASENSNRLAIANRIMKKGGTAAEAMYQAQDIMNFTMSGDYAAVQFLIRTVPFLNARMQGVYRLARGARDHPVGFMLKGSALMAASLALLARNWDDENYEVLEDWMKDTNWSFFAGGMHYTIPKPFEVGFLFATVPERVARSILGRDDIEVSKDALVRGFGETLAFNPIPQLFKPMVEQYSNHNMFTGRPIEGMGISGYEHKYRHTPWTSPAAVKVGEAMPDWSGPVQSPARIQHMIRAYTGTVGLYTLNAVDWLISQADSDLPPRPSKRWYEKPVISRIVKGRSDTTRYNKYEDKLYDVIDQSDAAQKTFNMLAKQGRIEEAKEVAGKRKHLINPDIDPETGQAMDRDAITPRTELAKVQKAIREINTAQRALMANKTMDGDKKRDRMDEMTRAKNRVLSQAAKLLQKLDDLKE